MKFKIISDLHLADTNTYGILNKQEEVIAWVDDSTEGNIDTTTLIAGDISSDASVRERFFKALRHCHGVFVEGNHILYNSKPLQNNIMECKALSKTLGNWKYLENGTYVDPDNPDYLIVGAILWTDFNLLGRREHSMRVAERGMNDYYVGKIYDPKATTVDLSRRIIPEDVLNLHKTSFRYIHKICKSNPDKKIIVLTHHAPSVKSSEERYVESERNPAYCSNLDSFILDNPNIKLWAHGHVHHSDEYMIGGCKVVCNAYGYRGETHPKITIVEI